MVVVPQTTKLDFSHALLFSMFFRGFYVFYVCFFVCMCVPVCVPLQSLWPLRVCPYKMRVLFITTWIVTGYIRKLLNSERRVKILRTFGPINKEMHYLFITSGFNTVLGDYWLDVHGFFIICSLFLWSNWIISLRSKI